MNATHERKGKLKDLIVNPAILENEEYTLPLLKLKKKKKKKDKHVETFANIVLPKKNKKCHKTFDKQHNKKSKTHQIKIFDNCLEDDNTNNQTNSTRNTSNENEEHLTSSQKTKKKMKKKKKKKKSKSVDKDILYVDMIPPKKHKKDRQVSCHKPLDNYDSNPNMTFSENSDVITSHNSNIPEDDGYTLLLKKMLKKMKKKKLNESVTELHKKKHKTYEKKLKNKTAVSNKETHNPITVRSDVSNKSTKFISALKEQKLKTRVEKKKGELIDVPTLISSEELENTSKFPKAVMKKKKKKKNDHKEVVFKDAAVPKRKKKQKQQTLCHEPYNYSDTCQVVMSSQNNDVPTSPQENISKDVDYISLSKSIDNKMKQNNHNIHNTEVVHQENKIIPKKTKKNKKKTISDENHKTKVKNETIVSNDSHFKVHTGEHPFTCDVCGKSFACTSSLNNHYRIHTTEQPYKCDLCGKSFYSKSNLNYHNRLHTDVPTSYQENISKDVDYMALSKTIEIKMMQNRLNNKLVNQEEKMIAKKTKTNKKNTMSDENHEKVVKMKTVVSNKEMYNPEIVKSDVSNASTKYVSASEEQKIMNNVEQEDVNANSRANSSLNTFNFNEDHTSLLQEKKKKKKKNIEDVLYVDTVAPKTHKKGEQISCHKPYDLFDSENIVVTSNNFNTAEDDEYTSLLKKFIKKKEKTKHNESVTQFSKKKHKSDTKHEKIVKYKTVVSNKETQKPKIIKSDVSGKSTKYISALKEEKIKTYVEKEGLYMCKFCDKKFNDASVLSVHQNTHTNSFKCKDCSMSFNKQSLLIKHSRSHIVKQILECRSCDKIFKSKSNLNRHNKIHASVRPYVCKTCDKSFNRKDNLITHNRVHTGERPYTCDICGNTFAQTSTLHQHKKTHTGERPYTCDICDQAFASISNLHTHYRIHTEYITVPNQPYTCDICDKTFSYKSTLVIIGPLPTAYWRYTI